MKTEKFHSVLSYFMVITGAMIYGFGFNLFLLSAKIPPGGFTGIATILNHITRIRIGYFMIAMNIPLLVIWGFRNGFKPVIKTIIATTAMSFFTELFSFIHPVTDSRLLSSVYGGILLGLGLGIILINGATSGGSDILAYSIKKTFMKQVSLGHILLALDVIVISTYALVINDIEAALYAGVEKFISSYMINLLSSGGERSKTVMVITKKPDLIAQEIHRHIGRGATLLNGQGMYSKHSVNVLMIVVKRNQIIKLRKIILKIDPNVFMTLIDSADVWGKGFLQNSESQKA